MNVNKSPSVAGEENAIEHTVGMTGLTPDQLARLSHLLDTIIRSVKSLSVEFSSVSEEEWEKIIEEVIEISTLKLPEPHIEAQPTDPLNEIQEAPGPTGMNSYGQLIKDAMLVTMYGDNKTSLNSSQIQSAAGAIVRTWGWSPPLGVMTEAKKVSLSLNTGIGITPFETTAWISSRRQARQKERSTPSKPIQKAPVGVRKRAILAKKKS